MCKSVSGFYSMPSVYLSVLAPVLQYLNYYNFCNKSWYLVGKLFLPVLKRVLSIIGSLPFHINYLSHSPKIPVRILIEITLNLYIRLRRALKKYHLFTWCYHLGRIWTCPCLPDSATFHILGYKQPTEKDTEPLDLWWEHSGGPLPLLKGRKSLARF